MFKRTKSAAICTTKSADQGGDFTPANVDTAILPESTTGHRRTVSTRVQHLLHRELHLRFVYGIYSSATLTASRATTTYTECGIYTKYEINTECSIRASQIKTFAHENKVARATGTSLTKARCLHENRHELSPSPATTRLPARREPGSLHVKQNA